ncbi:hypothetical protein [Rhizobium ruizarguesonis]|jgi:hypothetical protein|nr:hypothetical protein [Rhizobium ruizarguesonis]WSH22466.1 hypothetical protein U8Q07_09015 [Rhizobium ruizarguesonis]
MSEETLLDVVAKYRRGATAKERERALCSANVVLRIALATAEG